MCVECVSATIRSPATEIKRVTGKIDIMFKTCHAWNNTQTIITQNMGGLNKPVCHKMVDEKNRACSTAHMTHIINELVADIIYHYLTS